MTIKKTIVCLLPSLLFLPNLFGTEWTLGGGFKSLANYRHMRDENIFKEQNLPSSEQRLRTQALWRGTNGLLEYAGESSFLYGKSGEPVFKLPDFETRSVWKAEWSWFDRDGTKLSHRIDRLYTQWRWEPFEIRIGKQVTRIGEGQIFNALYQGPTQSFVSIDSEFQRGEEAVTIKKEGETGIEARFLPKTPGQQKNNFNLLVKRALLGMEGSLMTGLSDDKSMGGIELDRKSVV